jgi:hypothetical protein
MAKLVVSFKDKVVGEFPLDKERIVIGRKPDSDIVLDNLSVSGEHAAVVTIYNYHFLEDLDSTNGTQINGQDVKKQVLSHNDLITVGKHQIRYVNEEAATGEGMDKTVMIRRPTPVRKPEPEMEPETGSGPPPSAKTPLPAAASPPKSPAYLTILNGPGRGKHLELTTASTTIGRKGAQLAVILKRRDGYYLAPGVGRSQPLVNGTSVAEQLRLKHEDIIEFDRVRMQFNVTG